MARPGMPIHHALRIRALVEYVDALKRQQHQFHGGSALERLSADGASMRLPVIRLSLPPGGEGAIVVPGIQLPCLLVL